MVTWGAYVPYLCTFCHLLGVAAGPWPCKTARVVECERSALQTKLREHLRKHLRDPSHDPFREPSREP